jgi:hypothetical protein
VAALLVAGQFDPGATAVLETRGGEAPRIPGQSPEATVGAVFTPGADVRYLGHDLDLRLAFDDRIYVYSSTGDAHAYETPLYLYSLLFSADGKPTPRSHVTSRATVLYGAADYAYLPLIFGTSAATLRLAPQIFSASGEVSIQDHATERVDLTLVLGANHHRPVGNNMPIMVPVETMGIPAFLQYIIPVYTSVTATPGAAVRLTRTDKLMLSCLFEGEHISRIPTLLSTTDTHTLESYTVVPTIGTRSFLARDKTLDLHVAVALNHLVSTVPVEAYSATPVGGVVYEQRLIGWRESMLTMTTGELIDFYVDPVLATAAPRSVTSASLVLALPEVWSIGLEASYASSLSAHPIGTPGNLYYPDEVSYSLAVPVRHRLSEFLQMEFGGRWSDRRPFYTADAGYGFHQLQLWLYVSLSGTTRPTLRPVAQPIAQ